MTDIRDAASTLVPLVRERIEEIETSRRLPEDLARAMARAGLYRMLVPRAAGGLECPPSEALQVIETMGWADASAGWCTMIAATSGLVAGYLPAAVAAEIFGRADGIAGGVFAPQGRAVAEGAAWRVSGRWQWASGSPNCDWLMGGCMIYDGEEMRRLSDGRPESRMMLFPRREVNLIDTWHAAGLAGTGSGDMAVENVRVPQERSVSIVTDSPVAEGPLYAFPIFGLLALGIAGVALGNARGALDELAGLAEGKRRQGSRRTIAETAHGQMTLAQCEARWSAARCYLYDTVARAWQQAQGPGRIDTRLRAQLRLAATHATRTSADVTRAMYDLGGGASVFLSSSLQRRFRDGHVATQHMMVSPSTWELAGRTLFGLPVDSTFL